MSKKKTTAKSEAPKPNIWLLAIIVGVVLYATGIIKFDTGPGPAPGPNNPVGPVSTTQEKINKDLAAAMAGVPTMKADAADFAALFQEAERDVRSSTEPKTHSQFRRYMNTLGKAGTNGTTKGRYPNIPNTLADLTKAVLGPEKQGDLTPEDREAISDFLHQMTIGFEKVAK